MFPADWALYLGFLSQGESRGARVLRRVAQTFDLSPAYAAVACFYIVRPEAFSTEKKWVEVNPRTPPSGPMIFPAAETDKKVSEETRGGSRW